LVLEKKLMEERELEDALSYERILGIVWIWGYLQ
jgi:hypothetical protein